MPQSKTKSGFAFGVLLGAVVGTGAMLMTHSAEGKKTAKKLGSTIKNGLKDIKEKFPEKTEAFESALNLAMEEAKKATEEIKTLSNSATSAAKTKETVMKAAKKVATKTDSKRTFSKAGKKLETNT